jgi:DNA-binding CsgD family transcriptional regulator
VALTDGADDQAMAMAEDYYQVRRSSDLARPARRDNTLLGAALAARATDDPDELRRLADGLDDLLLRFERKGEHTEEALGHLVTAGILRRAGLEAEAGPHRQRCQAMRRTFRDTAFLDRLEAWVDTNLVDAPAVSTSSIDRLTPRQREVAALLPTELSVAAIAEQLFISPHTLRTHLREIYRRLGVRSRHEAVARLQ